ncbi:hypothetical protein [Kitasatospora sp. NPDC057015]
MGTDTAFGPADESGGRPVARRVEGAGVEAELPTRLPGRIVVTV